MSTETQQREIAAAIVNAFSVKPMQSWGSLVDLDLRAWWDKNNCNRFYVLPGVPTTATISKVTLSPTVKRAAYIELWRSLKNPILLNQLDHACLAFWTLTPGGIIQTGDELALATTARKAYTGKLLASLGGWDNCTNFSVVFASPTLRSNCIQNLGYMLSTYKLDGLDLDWELPSSTDMPNLISFVREFKARFPTMLVSLAVPSDPGVYADQGPLLSNLVDMFHVMTYDYTGPWMNTITYNSDLAQGGLSISNWINAGIPSSKLWLGSAWYGREATSIGYGMSATWAADGVSESTYATIANTMLGQSDWVKSHPAPGTAWLQSSSKCSCISFEDPQAVREKVTWAGNAGIAGVFCWSWGQDDDKASLATALLT